MRSYSFNTADIFAESSLEIFVAAPSCWPIKIMLTMASSKASFFLLSNFNMMKCS